MLTSDPPDVMPAQAEMRSIPAPIGGYNARDGLAGMPETDAAELINWIPDLGGIRVRRGYMEWNTGLGDTVKGIFSYFAPATAFPAGSFLVTPTSMPGFLFSSTDAAIYDSTTQGVIGAAVRALSGLSNAGWINSCQLTNSGGTFALICSEADGYFTFDGAAWVKVTLGVGAQQVSVSDPTKFVHPLFWKRRAWFVIKDTTKAAYLPADAIYGIAAEFDFGPIFKHGGHLSYLTNWTIDAGEGIDDFLVAVSSNGDVAVYKGTDPTSITTFALVGTWFIGQVPIGRRAFCQFGGDIVLAGADGLYPISYVTRGGADFLVASSKEYTSKIRAAIGQDLRASFTNRGWQLFLHPSERLLVANVPDYSSITTRQYAMNTTLNQWTKFVGVPIYCLGSTAGYTFSGTTDGRVMLLFTGVYDNLALGQSIGNSIAGVIVPAFTMFGLPGVQKQVLMVKPNFIGTEAPSVQCDVSVNYNVNLPAGSPSFVISTSSKWNSSLWNTGIWGGATQVFSEWFQTGEVGFAFAATIKTLTAGDLTLASIDYVYQKGGVL